MSPPFTADKFPPAIAAKLSTLFVFIEVGKDDNKRTFEAFKRVLSFYSGYFAAALNGRFREAIEGAVQLTTEDPLIFELFLHWACTRCFYESTLDPTVLVSYDTIAQAWIFGDAHEVPLLQNAVMEIFELKLRGTMMCQERETIGFIWENTPPGAALRNLVIDFVSMLVESTTPTIERERSELWRTQRAAQAAWTDWYVEGETDINDLIHERPPLDPKPRQWEAYGDGMCRRHVHNEGESCTKNAEEKQEPSAEEEG